MIGKYFDLDNIRTYMNFRMKIFQSGVEKNIYAPGEARTHGLQIMRLTRCLLRYRGLVKSEYLTK